MYCSGCGSQINKKLNFCNNCGAKHARKDESDEKGPKSILEGLVISVTFIAICGLGILIGLVAVLLGNDLPFDAVALISTIYLMVLGGICFMLLRPVSRLVTAQIAERNGENIVEYQAPQLAQPGMAALNSSPGPVASVTEHTTRTLDEVKIER